MSSHPPSTHGPDLQLRRRAATFIACFVLVQGIFAAIVLTRAKYLERRRDARRPATYPSRDFPPVALEHDDDEAHLYMRGDELLDDVVAAIDSAQTQILFETFIWVDDAAGTRVRDALARAADRGVRVHVLWDWLLSDRGLDDGYFPKNVEAFPFRQVRTAPGYLRPHNLLRDHRKVLVVDERVAFVGGYNVGEEYLGWRDTHLRIAGPSALEVANAFGDFWNEHAPAHATPLPDVPGRPWDPHVVVHRNDPSLAIFPIRGMYLEAIDRAERRIWLTTAYFVPDRSFRGALLDAARRGVDVRILLPARSNHPITDVLAHGMFDELLSTGARIFLYRDFMVHAKTGLIDDQWVTVGTANLDRWSMLGNYEINLELRSPRLAEQMAAMFELDMEQCEEVLLGAWRRRPLHWRLTERVLRSLSPLM